MKTIDLTKDDSKGCEILSFWSKAWNWLTAHERRQQALQWWHHRYLVQLRSEAETIRSQLLQDSFVLRRHLELSSQHLSSQYTDSDSADLLLKPANSLHQALTELSDRLAPPFLDENLLLAVQAQVEIWKCRYYNRSIQLILPQEWQQESYEQRATVLLILNEVLEFSFRAAEAESISICLAKSDQFKEMKIQMTSLHAENANLDITQFNNLYEVFRLLMPGKCFYRRKQNTITWYFRWKSIELSSTNPNQFP